MHNKRTHNQGGQLRKRDELKRRQLCLNIVVLFKIIEEQAVKMTEIITNIQYSELICPICICILNCFSQVLSTVLSEEKNKTVGRKRHGCRKVCTDITCRCRVQTSCNGIQWIKQRCLLLLLYRGLLLHFLPLIIKPSDWMVAPPVLPVYQEVSLALLLSC